MGWKNDTRENRLPAVLLGYQRRWIEDATPVKVYEKSRRIGVSWTEAADCALLAAGAKGMNTWYIGYNKDMAQEFIADCADWARFYNLAASQVEEVVLEDEARNIAAFRIRFSSGRKITALSSRPANLRGKQGRIVIDEAAFHDDLAGLLKAALAMLMWGGQVHVISTHNGDENAFNELVGDIRAGKKPYSLHRTTLDDALSDGLYKRICLRLGRDWSAEREAAWRAELIEFYGADADEELFCIPAKGAGVYLPRTLVETCMSDDAPVLRLGCSGEFAELPDSVRFAEINDWLADNLAPLLDKFPPNLPVYFGEDFGRSGDLSVIWPLIEEPGMTYRTPLVIEMRNVPFRQQEQVLFYLVDSLPRFAGGALDSRGNGQYLAEVAMQRYGSYRIHQVMLSREWYRDNMPPYKAAFEEKTITAPKDADILDDHRAVRMEKGVAKVPETYRGKGRDGGQRHGDAAIAGALALFAARNTEAGPVEYKTVQPRRLAKIVGAW